MMVKKGNAHPRASFVPQKTSRGQAVKQHCCSIEGGRTGYEQQQNVY